MTEDTPPIQEKWAPHDVAKAQKVHDPLAGLGEFSSRLRLDHRLIFLTSEIPDEDDITEIGLSGFLTSLRVLDVMDPGKPITLYINSIGGDIAAGMAIILTMRDLESPVHTFVVGMAASMAALIAVAGTKRYAYPTARWLLHRGKGMAEGDHQDLLIQAKELKVVDSYGDQVILNFTKIKAKQLDEFQKKDFWFGAKEALKFGVVDEIITPKQGPKMWVPKPKSGE